MSTKATVGANSRVESAVGGRRGGNWAGSTRGHSLLSTARGFRPGVASDRRAQW